PEKFTCYPSYQNRHIPTKTSTEVTSVLRRISQVASWLALALIGTLLLSAGALAQQRRGAWVDEVIMSEEANAATAITRLEVGEIDLYAFAKIGRASCRERGGGRGGGV